MFATVILVLVLVGIGYNAFVAWFQERHKGYTAIFVVGGVALTLMGAALLVGVQDALLVGACFAASGLPMVLGSMLRNAADGAQARKLARELMDDKQTESWGLQVAPGAREGDER